MNAPNGWQVKPLSALAQYINGYAFKPDHWGKDGLPIIRIEQLKDPKTITDYFSGRLPDAIIIEDGDLVFSWSASLFLRIWNHGRAALNQHLFKVVEAESVNRLFLKLLIEHSLPELTKASHGSTMQHITRKELGRFTTSLPSDTHEQSKIAEVLSTVDRAIAQTEALIAKQQRIKAGLMQDLLTRGIDEHGQPRSETIHSNLVPLSELAVINPPRGRVNISGATPVSFIPMADVSEFGRWTTRQVRPYSQVANGYTPFLDGDVLFAKITPCMENGKGCHAVGLVNGLGFASSEFHVLRAKDDSDARFILQWTLDHNFRQKAAAKMTGSAGQQRVPVSFFDNFFVPHFKRSEQAKIAKVLTGADEMIEQDQSKLTKLSHLKTALMQDLLTGKVRVTPLLQPAMEANA